MRSELRRWWGLQLLTTILVALIVAGRYYGVAEHEFVARPIGRAGLRGEARGRVALAAPGGGLCMLGGGP